MIFRTGEHYQFLNSFSSSIPPGAVFFNISKPSFPAAGRRTFQCFNRRFPKAGHIHRNLPGFPISNMIPVKVISWKTVS